MQIKNLFVSVLILSFPVFVNAQDKIVKHNGETIDAKIKSVGTKTVTYVRFDNQTGPEYTIVKKDIEKIKYQNGSEDNFVEEVPVRRHHGRIHSASMTNETADPKEKYGKNLICLAPLQFTDNGLGLSLSYQRVLDKSGIIAFYMPVISTFNFNSRYFDNATQTYKNGNQDMMIYFMPGVVLYPTGAFGHVRYGIGPSLVYATGEKSSYNTNYGGYTTINTESRTQLGIVLNNSLNINPTNHIYLGLEFGLGFTYMNRVNGINQNSTAIAQGGFKMGYRF